MVRGFLELSSYVTDIASKATVFAIRDREINRPKIKDL